MLGVMVAGDAVEQVVLRNPHGAPTDPNNRLGYHDGPWTLEGRSRYRLMKMAFSQSHRTCFMPISEYRLDRRLGHGWRARLGGANSSRRAIASRLR